ncbi:MAG: hypothetical protein U9P14_03535 [Gemmatimonadota bacterium]|nr:hypothetical protein [Gemmatimonadota bacterium]
MKKTWSVESTASIYLVLILAGMLAAGHWSPLMGYGLSLLGDYPWPVAVVFICLALAGVLPPVRERIVSLLQGSPGQPAEPLLSSPRILIFSLLAALFSLVCPPVNPMMGDGPMYIYGMDTYFSTTEWMFEIKNPFCVIHTAMHQLLFLLLGQDLYYFVPAAQRAYLVWSVFSALGAVVFFNVLFRVTPVFAKHESMSRTLAAIILTMGTMAIFSGYIEYVTLRLSLFLIFIFVAIRSLKKGASPWLLMSVYIFCIGFYIAFIALGSAIACIVLYRWKQIRERPLNWLLAVVVPTAIFLIMVSFMVDLGDFLRLFYSGGDSLTLENKEDVLYGLFSWKHLLDLANVLLLHSPLNLLAGAWIVFALVRFPGRWSKDRITVLLLFLLGGFAAEMFIFNAKRGIFYDWDIFSYLGVLLPLTAFRLWEVCAPQRVAPRITRAIAVLLPLAVLHLVLWGITLHNRDILVKRLLSLEYSWKGSQMMASGLSDYCVNENYFPRYLLEAAGDNEALRRFLVYRLCRPDGLQHDLMFELAEEWSGKLEVLDLANIGGLLIDKKRFDESIYFMRLATNKAGGPIDRTSASNLALYYKIQNRPAACLFYSVYIPHDVLEIKNPQLYSYFKKVKEQGSFRDTVAMIREMASGQVYNNAIQLFKKASYKAAREEFLAALGLGIDGSRVIPYLKQIKNLQNSAEPASKDR